MNADMGDGDVRIATYHVDGLFHLAQLVGIATIVTTDIGLVYHEIEISLSLQVACLLLLCLRLEISQMIIGLVGLHNRHGHRFRLWLHDNGLGLLAKYVGNVQRQFRGTEIVVGPTFQQRSAPLVGILVVVEADIAYTQSRLEVPVVSESPGMSDGESATHEPTLIMVLLEGLHKRDGPDVATHIKLASEGMNACEPATKGPFVREPVAILGHQRPMAQLLGFRKLPGVEAVEQLECRALTHLSLDTEIGCQRSIIQQIVLQTPGLLGVGGAT